MLTLLTMWNAGVSRFLLCSLKMYNMSLCWSGHFDATTKSPFFSTTQGLPRCLVHHGHCSPQRTERGESMSSLWVTLFLKYKFTLSYLCPKLYNGLKFHSEKSQSLNWVEKPNTVCSWLTYSVTLWPPSPIMGPISICSAADNGALLLIQASQKLELGVCLRAQKQNECLAHAHMRQGLPSLVQNNNNKDKK